MLSQNPAPLPLIDLYRVHTGDDTATEGQVRKELLKDSENRRQAISLYLKGYTQIQIGAAMGVTHGSIAGRINRAMVKAYKAINNAPRHHKSMRGHGEFAIIAGIHQEAVEGVRVISAHGTLKVARVYQYRTGEPNAVVVRCDEPVYAGQAYRGAYTVVRGAAKKRKGTSNVTD